MRARRMAHGLHGRALTCTSWPTWKSPAVLPNPSEGPMAKREEAGAHSPDSTLFFSSMGGGGGAGALPVPEKLE